MAKNSTDKVVVLKIKKYVSHLGRVHEAIKDKSTDELEDDLLSYTAAQLITNLKETFDMIKSEEIQDRYKALRNPQIVRIRNIASHDYESLDWSVVKSGCKRIVELYNLDAYHDASLKIIDSKEDSPLIVELRERIKDSGNIPSSVFNKPK